MFSYCLSVSPYFNKTGSKPFLSGGTVDTIIDFLISEFTNFESLKFM